MPKFPLQPRPEFETGHKQSNRLFDSNELDHIVQAAVATGLTDASKRRLLFGGTVPELSAGLPTMTTTLDQLRSDISELNEICMAVQGIPLPLTIWLGNAARLSEPRVQSESFKQWADEAARRARPAMAGPRPSYPNEKIKKLGEQLNQLLRKREERILAGKDLSDVHSRILQVRRQLREGAQLQPGDFIGNNRYRLAEIIGSGGFATVWKAFDRQRSQTVAIKLLHNQYARDETRRERFNRGSRSMAALSHPNIVQIYKDDGIEGDLPFFVMEYLNGGDLQEAVLSRRIGVQDGLPIIQAVAKALHLAHQKGLVHRDVKPANILLDGAQDPKLTDFDLVQAGDTTGGTRTGALGTFIYSAPELMMDARSASPASDIFSLAMTAVFILYRQELPISAFKSTARFVGDLNCADRIKDVLIRALDERPGARYSSVVEFAKELREAADGRGDEEYLLRSVRNWESFVRGLFKTSVPATARWTDLNDIVTVLNLIGQPPTTNHLFFPSGGGMDLESARFSVEPGCLEFYTGGTAYVVKPVELVLETFGGNHLWSYFRLEAAALKPSGVYEDVSQYEEVAEISPGDYRDPDILEQGYLGYDEYDEEIPLPRGARRVMRYLGGSFVIFSKGSVYNMDSGTYDARHNKVSAADFREYIRDSCLIWDKKNGGLMHLRTRTASKV